VSTKADRIENYDEDDEIIIDDVVEPIKGLDDDDIDDDDDGIMTNQIQIEMMTMMNLTKRIILMKMMTKMRIN
jgi:hypothetical protein